MTNTALAVSLSALAFSLAVPAVAQEQDSARPDPERIIVTGEGLEEAPSEGAYAVTEIERERIVSTASGRIEDVLRDVAGFQQFRRSDSRSANPTAQGATLRALGGNATSRALVLLDGVPIADPFFGYIPFNAVQPETLSEIRVTRGGGRGRSARARSRERSNWKAPGRARSTRCSPAARSTTVRKPKRARCLPGNWARASRWRAGAGTGARVSSPRPKTSAFPPARAPPSTTGRSACAVQRHCRARSKCRRASLFSRTTARCASRARIRPMKARMRACASSGGAIGRSMRSPMSRRAISPTSSSPPPVSSACSTRGTRLRPASAASSSCARPWARTTRCGWGSITAVPTGNCRRKPTAHSPARCVSGGGQGASTPNLGLFIEDDWSLGRLLLTGGLRADRTAISDGFFRAVDASGAVVEETRAPDRSDWALSWRAGAAYQASDALRLRAAAYTGLRLPTLNELYRPFVVFPVVTQANAALENERLEGFEVGVDWQAGEAVGVSLTAFDNRVENAIANVTLAPNLRQRRNLPAIEAQGIEGNLALALGQVSLNASLAYTDAVVDGEGPSLPLDGNRPPQTPDFAASATLAWEPAAGWRLAATLRHTARQFEDDRETDVLPAVTTLDAFAQIPVWREFSLVLRGENLTDEEIVTRNAGGAIDLGVPRTLWAGLRYGF